MEIHTHCHDQNDSQYADYGSDAHGHIPAVYTEAKYNRNDDEQHGDHGYGSRSLGRRQIQSAALIVYSAEGRSYDRSKGCYHQNQGQVREDDEQLLCALAHVRGNNLTDGLSFIADRSKQRAEVMDAAEENTANQNPEGYGQPSEHRCTDGSGNRACACDGGKMMAHQNRSFCRNVVYAVLHGMSRCLSFAVTYAPLLAQPSAVADITYNQDCNADEKKYQ